MPYITVKRGGRNHQITFEDILFDRVPQITAIPAANTGDTVTFNVVRAENVEKYARRFNIGNLVEMLEYFNNEHAALFEADRASLYHKFYIPKRSGGYREINEPLPELMTALRNLKLMFETHFNMTHHTAAFAYVKGRSTVDAVKRHQRNKSRWFLKTDFSDFFGSTTEDFTFRMISMLFPFSQVVKSKRGADALRKTLSLCFLNGGLPQGTPISPALTNACMIPIDHKLANDLVKLGFTYTRYADDILISHRESFQFREVCQQINDALKEFGAPFAIKDAKTRYGSSSGRNWNLGVMLNGNNEITIGRKNKEYLKAACTNYVRDKRNNVAWDPHDIMVLRGKISYYKMVEPDYVDKFIQWFNQKNGVCLMKMLRDDLR